MADESASLLYKSEAQLSDSQNLVIAPDPHQEQYPIFRRVRVVRLLAGVLFLATAVFFTWATYYFAVWVDTKYNSHSWSMDRVVGDGDDGLQKRDELGTGQLVGVVAGALTLVLIGCFILWMFSSVARQVSGSRDSRH